MEESLDDRKSDLPTEFISKNALAKSKELEACVFVSPGFGKDARVVKVAGREAAHGEDEGDEIWGDGTLWGKVGCTRETGQTTGEGGLATRPTHFEGKSACGE